MSFILTDTSNVTTYTFPDGFVRSFTDRDFKANSRLLSRFGTDGLREIGDKTIQSREVQIEGYMSEDSEAALELAIDELIENLRNNGNAFRFSWRSGIYINVDTVKKFKKDLIDDSPRWNKSTFVSFTFVCADPFWYSTTEDSVAATAISASPTNITFTNNGNIPSPLTLQFDATGDWPDIDVMNDTDEDNLFTLDDPAFISGEQTVVDGENGTVEKDNVNIVRYFSGAFLRVLPGANTIVVTGTTGSGTVTLTAPRRNL